MPLFEMTPGDLVAVPSPAFEAERVLERTDLQRLLRAHIDAIVDDVLVVSEEFGAFADARRRIDLLGIDPEGRLVVLRDSNARPTAGIWSSRRCRSVRSKTRSASNAGDGTATRSPGVISNNGMT